MSSHREAPEIAKDPVADNTDVYAFVSPDKPNTVTILANYIPLEGPAGGPNFFSFGDDVLYEIHIDNNGDGLPELTYQFRFQTQTRNPNTFLYNTGPITSLDSKNWNRPQLYSVTLVNKGKATKLGDKLTTPPCNIGPRSTPHYEKLAEAAVHSLPGGATVFAGQRAEGFFVDLGSVFDLLDLRPFQNLHLIPSGSANGVNGTKGLSVHTIALQIPKKMLTRDGSAATDAKDARSVIGVWASASRQKARVRSGPRGEEIGTGPWVQVSRLGNPLFNEVIVPLGDKDYWNSVPPAEDKAFAKYVHNPELAHLIPALYPNTFPRLAALKAPRADLAAILLTGIPSGLIPNFQNFTGKTQADMLRLNMAIPPTSNPNKLGLLGNDLAGFPNGRRLIDDVVTIELRAVAGVTYPLIDHKFEPDAAASKVTDGVTADYNSGPFLNQFPYLGTPVSGYAAS